MAAHNPNTGTRLIPAALLAWGAWTVLDMTGPIVKGATIDPASAAAAVVLVAAGCALVADGLMLAANIIDRIKARTPTGLKGTSGWVKSLREINHDLLHDVWGPYFGTFKGKEIIVDYASNALTLGPAGAGKGIGELRPTTMAIRHSKTIIDFKGELACVLAEPLRKRGERVKILNLGDMWPERLGNSDQYNPLVVIADDFWRPGGTMDVSDDVHELCMQLYPEPPGADTDSEDGYWRDGARRFLDFGIQMCVLIKGYDATLGDVVQLLNDRTSLLQHALWASGRLQQQEDDQS